MSAFTSCLAHFNLGKVHSSLAGYVYYFQFTAKSIRSTHNALLFSSLSIVGSEQDLSRKRTALCCWRKLSREEQSQQLRGEKALPYLFIEASSQQGHKTKENVHTKIG